jgi:D-threonate/D-erythronate kinase
MVNLAVIADDLTGANDTGVQFAKKGLDTIVLFSDTQLQPPHLNSDILVLNSDSRGLSTQEAYNAVCTLSEQLKNEGIKQILKKIDSTMRGNVGAEIDAVMDVFKFKTSFLVPAFPKSERITVYGKHYVYGVPLEKTEIANDPTNPVKESFLPILVQKQSKRKVELITIESVRKGKTHLAEIMNQLTSGEASRIVVIDAVTEEDLKTIVKAAQFLEENILWVGSAGIAYHLCSTKQQKEPFRKEQQSTNRLPVLIVAGSVTSVTYQQVQELKNQMSIEEIVISPEKFLDETIRNQEIERVVKEGQVILQEGDLVIATNRSSEAIERVRAVQQSLGLTNLEAGAIIARSMGVIAGLLIKNRNISGAILTGGDIAGATCKILNGKGIRVVGEVEDGLPYGKLFGGVFDGLPLVTKAGAFGTEQALVKAMQTLTEIYDEQESIFWNSCNP